MTRLVRLCIASALLAFHAAAQTWTLPAELDLTDGGGSLALPFDAEAACHYMEVHRAWPGASPAPLSSMSFRRGVKGANPSATSRTASILLRMGHGSPP